MSRFLNFPVAPVSTSLDIQVLCYTINLPLRYYTILRGVPEWSWSRSESFVCLKALFFLFFRFISPIVSQADTHWLHLRWNLIPLLFGEYQSADDAWAMNERIGANETRGQGRACVDELHNYSYSNTWVMISSSSMSETWLLELSHPFNQTRGHQSSHQEISNNHKLHCT